MSDLVDLEHDTMPGRTISVPEAGVWHRERAGWRRCAVQMHPGYGEPLEAVEHPADGTTSPEVANDEPTRSKDAASDDTTETEH